MIRLMRSPAVWCVVLLTWLECVIADDGMCYTSGSVAGIVIATIVVTLVMGALAAAFVWYLWKQRKGEFGRGNKSTEKPIACPPMSPDKQLIARENNDYAFDNPYFRDDEVDNVKQDAAEKGESGFRLDNGDITPSQKAKQTSNGTTGVQPKKNRPFSSLPFHSVFHPSGKKQRAMDDTYISKHLERLTVPLRGHDFTGLGFNICGNMRDGIFVKDVLHRGPASESGKIRAGDRIVGVTVSFGAMVYEDALTILSYASPYDVRLEIEKCSSAGPLLHPSNASPKKLGASTSFRSGDQRRLFHPLYRSQSIDDLTQIGKDAFLGGNSPAVPERSQREPATPKRSQSVEASSNGGPKARTVKSGEESKSTSGSKGSRKSSVSSCESTGRNTIPIQPERPAPEKEDVVVKKEVKSSRFRVEQINVKTEAPARVPPPTKPSREAPAAPEEQKHMAENVETVIVTEKSTESSTTPKETTKDSHHEPQAGEEAEKPTAPPRRTSTPAKRKAPAPPPSTPPSKTETAAVVHREDEKVLPNDSAVREEPPPSTDSVATDMPPPPPTTQVPDPIVQDRGEQDMVSSDESSLSSGGRASDSPKEDPAKRKASSLGDLTKLDQESGKKAPVSSAVLERAVSMDLQQSMPGENLGNQKKILRAPTFEAECEENREVDANDAEPSTAGKLKRWDDGLDKVLGGLTNGHHDVEDSHEDTLLLSTTEQSIEDPPTIKEEIATEDPPPKTDLLLKQILAVELDASSSSDGELFYREEEDKQLTSTPTKKLIEVKSFLKDDDISLDDVPYLGSASPTKTCDPEESPAAITTKQQTIRTSSASGSTSLFSPVTISIPIIKPDLKHFEKLPSPPTEASWMLPNRSTTSPEDMTKSVLERISVQSLYRPLFTTKDSTEADESNPEKLLNGTDSDSSADHSYSTAQENNNTATSLETSTMSFTLTTNNNDISFTTNNNDISLTPNKDKSSTTNNNAVPLTTTNNNAVSLTTINNNDISLTTNNNNDISLTTNNNNVTVKTPNNVAGFAKTLIIPGPNEVENLLSLAAEPITPPPQMDKPQKQIENE